MPTPTIPFYTNVKGLLGKAFNKLKDKDFSKKLTEGYHSNADKIPPKLHQIIYDTLKDTGFSANLEDIPYNFLANAKSSQLNPDNVFLMSPAQQKAALESLGYKQVDTTNGYGLVNSAVQKYKSATGRDVPMYQIGADDAQREQLILLKTDDQYTPAHNYKWIAIEEYPNGTGHWQTEETGPNMGDTASTPTRYYRDKNGNIYTKSWDFFDHGDYSRAQYDDKVRGGYVARTLTDMSQEYGNLLDVAGNPFVKTTGYTKVITDPHGHLKNNALDDALRAIVGIDEYYHNNLDYETNQDRVLRDVMAGKYDYKKRGGILKAQHGNKLLNKWQQLYDSKFGNTMRKFFLGSQETNELGQPKYVGSSGMLGMLVSPEFEGLEFPEITAMHYGMKGKPIGNAIEAERLTTVPKATSGVAKTKAVDQSFNKFLEKSAQEQDNIVRYWNGENFSNYQQLQRNPSQLKRFKNWLKKKK